MPKLAIVVSTLFLLGSAAACGTSGSSDADTTTTAAVATSTTGGDDEATTTTGDDTPDTTDTTDTTEATGGTDDADAYVAAIAENLQSNDADAGELAFEPQQADCVATAWVDIIGVDAFTTNDLSATDIAEDNFQFTELGLDEGQAGDMVDVIDECGIDAIATLRESLNEGLDATQQKCLAAELEDDTVRSLLIATIVDGTPGDDVGQELDRIETTCQLG